MYFASFLTLFSLVISLLQDALVKYITFKNKVRKRKKEREGWKCKDGSISVRGGALKEGNI